MLIRSCAVALGVLFVASSVVRAQAPAATADLPDYSQEAFVVEEQHTLFRFDDEGTGRRDSRFRVRVQSDAGVQHWGQLLFGYNAATERLDIQSVRVRKSDGAVITAPVDAIQDLSSPIQREAPVYTDFRQKHVTVPGLRPGDMLEVSYTTEVHTPLARGHFWLEYDFEPLGVVLDDRLELDVPAGRAIILRTAPGLDPSVQDASGRRVYRWSRAQTTPTADWLNAAQDNDSDGTSDVRLTTFQSWDEVGRWYARLETASRAVSPEVRAKALEITRGAATDLDRLQALYDYVAPNFRYVSISLGIGRYQPRAAADVLRDQYGDCKDKHTLLASLLESVGLRASTVLIHSIATLDPDFPSPSQFDHVITRVEADGRVVWLDVTPEVAPFELLSAGLRHKQALVVADGSGRLEDTPPDPPSGNAFAREIDGSLDDEGTLSARVRYTLRGDLELLFRSIFFRAPSARWREVVTAMDVAGGVRGTIGEWKVSDPLATREPFVMEYHVTRTNFVDWSKKTFDLRLPWSDFDLPEHDGGTSLELGSPIDLTYRLDLTLGGGYTARMPVPVSVNRDYGTYAATYDRQERRVTAERRLRLAARTLPGDRAADYAAFRRIVTADEAQMLGLDLPATGRVASQTAVSAEELLRTAMEAARGGNVGQAVPALTRLVEMEPGHETAWGVLGAALAVTGDPDAALAAFTRQVEINPFDEIAYSSIGALHLQRQRFDEAEAAFLKQLEVNPLDRRTPAMLGRLYLSMKRYADAAEQLERAAAIEPGDAFLHVERGRAYLNLDRGDAALAAFDRAVEISPTAAIWNNVAYYLAEAGEHLDRAQQYAESAVASATSLARNLTIDRITARELSAVRSLASYWDTLGWVFFGRGDLERAERLIDASWRLGQTPVVGDHLAQIYERQGRRELAIETYAQALSLGGADPGIRDRLLALAGSPERTDALILEHAGDLPRLRTVAIAPAPVTGIAEFFVLLGGAGVEGVSFIDGDETLREMTAAIRAADFSGWLPEAPAKLLRRGALACSTATGQPVCSFVLLRSGDARPAGADAGVLFPPDLELPR